MFEYFLKAAIEMNKGNISMFLTEISEPRSHKYRSAYGRKTNTRQYQKSSRLHKGEIQRHCDSKMLLLEIKLQTSDCYAFVSNRDAQFAASVINAKGKNAEVKI